jgi:hypothetical protein
VGPPLSVKTARRIYAFAPGGQVTVVVNDRQVRRERHAVPPDGV